MSVDRMDHELEKQLASLVEALTTSGSTTLDVQQLKQFKKICKTSDMYVQHAFRLLMSQLKKEHAEIRLSTFQVIDEVFSRSHVFRELLVSDFQNFLELTVETDQQHQPLPPPRAAANKLKADTLKAVQQWQEKYGSAYKKLALGYNFLKTCKHVNFNDIRARTLAERQRQERQEQQKRKALAAKLEKARKEFSELQKEILDTATEAENCINLLLPKPDLLFTESDFGIETTVDGASKPRNTLSDKDSSLQCASSSSISTCEFEDPTFKTKVHNGTSELSDNTEKQEASMETSSKPFDSGNAKSGSERESSSQSNLGDTTHKGCDRKSDDTYAVTKDDDEEEESDGDFEAVDTEEAEELNMVQTHGLGNRQYNLQIEIGSEVHFTETDDNRDLFHNLKDSSCLIAMRYLPQVIKWLEVLSKTGGSQAEIKKMIDLKVRLEYIRTECRELHLIPQSGGQEQVSDSDDEMEEVPEKEGYEPVIPAHLRAEYGLGPASNQSTSSSTLSSCRVARVPSTTTQSKKKKVTETATSASASSSNQKSGAVHWNLNDRHMAAVVQDPTSRAASIVKLGLKDDVRPSTSKDKPATVTSESSSEIPTLPFGLDLAYWENPDKVEMPVIQKNDSLHRFWVPAEVEHEKPSQNDVAAVMNRTFHYTGQFVPVKWKCRAKMPNGKLCERMDRVKCPFHGKIIPRDEDGKPSTSEECRKEQVEAATNVKAEATDGEGQEVPPWLDAELQADIEAATGHDLGSQRSKAKNDKAKGKGKGKGKGRKKKYEGLTDISEKKNTSRARLEAKVFSRKAVKRVASVLDAADYKRVRDKFGNQFNYSVN